MIQREVFGVRERERESGLIETEIKTESTRKKKMSRAGKRKNVLMCFFCGVRKSDENGRIF